MMEMETKVEPERSVVAWAWGGGGGSGYKRYKETPGLIDMFTILMVTWLHGYTHLSKCVKFYI